MVIKERMKESSKKEFSFLCIVNRFMYNQLLTCKCIISIYMILHKTCDKRKWYSKKLIPFSKSMKVRMTKSSVQCQSFVLSVSESLNKKLNLKATENWKKEKQLSEKVKLICKTSSFNISSSKTVYCTIQGPF